MRRSLAIRLGVVAVLLCCQGPAPGRASDGTPDTREEAADSILAEPAQTRADQAAMTPAEALQRLKEGNARFLAGKALARDLRQQVLETATGQYPFAAVLGCMDSRVPHEVVFDQGVGRLFSVRIAGNFADPEILGSLEYAAYIAGARLIVVLGHTECGAVKGACDDVELGNLTRTLSHIRPAVAAVTDVPGARDSKNKAFVEAVARANVKLALEDVRKRSSILDGMVGRGELALAGAIYDVKTGAVAFLE
jgi:carbonic anhydrase